MSVPETMNFHTNAVAYSGTTVGASMMNTIFQFYYVKLFLDVYKISEWWFNAAQIVYLIWNAINDPLFGYIQDTSSVKALKHRRLNILYGAPIYAASFLLPWFPWSQNGEPGWLTGLHLITTLCFFDAMLTFVLLAQCSLFAEISREEKERQITVKYSSVASVIGSCSIFICELVVTDLKQLRGLQMVCVIVAGLAWFLMACSAKYVTTVVDRDTPKDHILKEENKDRISMMTLIIQILLERKFVCFVIINFFQIFHMTFCANFFGIFRDNLIGPGVFSPKVLSLIAGSAFVLPQIVICLSGNMLAKFGSYTLVMWSFYAKVGMAFIMYGFGSSHFWLLALFMIADNTLCMAAFGLFNLLLSDIIDCDQKLYQRSHPVSSTVFGTNALITKPAQSLAPIVVVYILNQYGYQGADSKSVTSKQEKGPLTEMMFNLLCFIPILLGCIQVTVWRLYRRQSSKKKADLNHENY